LIHFYKRWLRIKNGDKYIYLEMAIVLN